MDPPGTSPSARLNGPSADAVRHELRTVQESAAFRGSNRCKSFLEFVVSKSLQGDGESLKERTLAVELFGRKAAADLADDSIVRVAAREVRKRLAQYYMGAGANDALRIELPAGSYVPVFHETRPLGPAAESMSSHPQAGHRWRAFVWLGAAALIVLAGAATTGWRLFSTPPSDFDVFWKPAFSQSSPVIIALAHPLVYHASTRANQLTDQKNGRLSQSIVQRPVDTDLLKGSDFVPVYDQYTGFGDTVAAVRLVVLFTQKSRPVRVRLASKLEFNDLRDSATVLVGVFTNRWTAELTRGFRYTFSYNEQRQPCIVDSTTGKGRWSLNKADNGKSQDDYIVICRLVHSQTGRFIIVGGGLTQYGTQEAGRILAEPDAMIPMLKQLPPEWSQKNLELVLHSQVMGDAPAQPELAAWHIW